jgi:subtilisin family serine protease
LLFADRVLGGFKTQKRVAVIVNLVPPARARQPTDWRSVQSMQTLHAANRAAEDNVLKTLTANEHKVRFRFDNQPGFSCEVTRKALDRLLNNPVVESIEPVRELHAHLAQGIPQINALASRSTYNGTNMAIAICDTGIDYNHPRLGGGGFPNSKVIGGYDFGNSDGDPMPVGEAHGTCCAGIAAGDLGTVGDYIGGVAPGAKLYALKISPDNSGSASSDAMIAAWNWCVTHKNDDPNNPIMVISTSFGGGQHFSACDSASPGMTTAANNAVAVGITVLASVGNDGFCDSIEWPACISSVISVGAVYDASFGTYYPCISSSSCAPKTFTAGGCSPYSTYYATDTTAADKVTSYSNIASFLDVLAPANQCYTLDIAGASGYDPGDYFAAFGGTSAACPYAAGAVACLQQAAKDLTGSYLTPADVRSRLAAYGDPVADTKVAIIKPRVNLGNAINEIAADLHVAPFSGLESSGQVGGAFSPSSQVYVLSNSSLSSLSWAVAKSQNWVSLSATNGTLLPSAATNITVSINANGNNLAVSNYTDTVIFTNVTTGSGSTTRPVTLIVQAPISTIFLADFEDGTGGYSADGFTYTASGGLSNLWHGSMRRSASPTHSQYYGLESGGNYDTGAQNAGNVQSPSISLTGVTAPITLSFKYWLQTENFPGYDVATVQLSTNAGGTWMTLATLPNSASFITWSGDISAHAGRNILVRFDFDTIDDFANAYEGWYVDDVTITGGVSASPFRITSILKSNNDILINWTTGIGQTNALQATAGTGNGSYSTDNFANIFIVTNTVTTSTNYTEVGAATNVPSRFYRVRLVP